MSEPTRSKIRAQDLDPEALNAEERLKAVLRHVLQVPPPKSDG